MMYRLVSAALLLLLLTAVLSANGMQRGESVSSASSESGPLLRSPDSMSRSRYSPRAGRKFIHTRSSSADYNHHRRQKSDISEPVMNDQKSMFKKPVVIQEKGSDRLLLQGKCAGIDFQTSTALREKLTFVMSIEPTAFIDNDQSSRVRLLIVTDPKPYMKTVDPTGRLLPQNITFHMFPTLTFTVYAQYSDDRTVAITGDPPLFFTAEQLQKAKLCSYSFNFHRSFTEAPLTETTKTAYTPLPADDSLQLRGRCTGVYFTHFHDHVWGNAVSMSIQSRLLLDTFTKSETRPLQLILIFHDDLPVVVNSKAANLDESDFIVVDSKEADLTFELNLRPANLAFTIYAQYSVDSSSRIIVANELYEHRFGEGARTRAELCSYTLNPKNAAAALEPSSECPRKPVRSRSWQKPLYSDIDKPELRLGGPCKGVSFSMKIDMNAPIYLNMTLEPDQLLESFRLRHHDADNLGLLVVMNPLPLIWDPGDYGHLFTLRSTSNDRHPFTVYVKYARQSSEANRTQVEFIRRAPPEYSADELEAARVCAYTLDENEDFGGPQRNPPDDPVGRAYIPLVHQSEDSAELSFQRLKTIPDEEPKEDKQKASCERSSSDAIKLTRQQSSEQENEVPPEEHAERRRSRLGSEILKAATDHKVYLPPPAADDWDIESPGDTDYGFFLQPPRADHWESASTGAIADSGDEYQAEIIQAVPDSESDSDPDSPSSSRRPSLKKASRPSFSSSLDEVFFPDTDPSDLETTHF